MSSVQLLGVFSSIDQYGQIHLRYAAYPSTVKRLAAKCSNGTHFPYDEAVAKIKLAAGTSSDQYSEFIGLETLCTVRVVNYTFVSQMPANRGEVVSGCKLVLLNAELPPPGYPGSNRQN